MKTLLLILALALSTGCDSVVKTTFDSPSWLDTDWGGELYNDLDLDHIGGSQGRVDSLYVTLALSAVDKGFGVRGIWRTQRPQFDDYEGSVYGRVTTYGFDVGQNAEWFNFIVSVGDGSAVWGDYKFNCWTNGEGAPFGALTCRRLRSSVDLANPNQTPPPFEIFYLSGK